MISVQSVDLAALGVTLPNDRVGIVLSQPQLSLTANEPYRCTPAARARQLQALTDTLNVARQHPHGLDKTHFTIFPEYTIPGIEGLARIDSALADDAWPRASVVIGGSDALSKNEFAALAQQERTHLHGFDPQNDVGVNQWINCAITWVKAADGSVHRWLQPKLAPAGPEQDVQFQDMYRGGSVFSFRGPLSNGLQYRFSCLVCFDWIATINGEIAWRQVLARLAQEVQPNELSISWFIIIQHNDKPSHDTFLEQVRAFFDQNVSPSVHRGATCLLFANTAGLGRPGRVKEFGTTSLIFSAQALFDKATCPLTYSADGRRFRGGKTLLDPFKQALFREGGACIHAFAQVNAGSLTAGPAGKRYAVENGSVFPLYGVVDPRVPSDSVPACVKWVNDELDELQQGTHRLGQKYSDAPMAAQINELHQQIVGAIRVLPAKSMTSYIELSAQESASKHADSWSDSEVEGLEHVLHSLSIVSLGFGVPDVGTDPTHATVTMNGQPVHLLAVKGGSHEECVEHAKKFLPADGQVLVISRDKDNTSWRKVLGSYLQPEANSVSVERDITDPAAGLLHIGYSDLLGMFRNEQTADALRGAIDGQFGK
jgi:hypothetical protein